MLLIHAVCECLLSGRKGIFIEENTRGLFLSSGIKLLQIDVMYTVSHIERSFVGTINCKAPWNLFFPLIK